MKSPIERKVVHLVIATGVASVVTQLVLVREFLAQFQGNELIIALILFNWLVLGGLGTRLAHWRQQARTGSCAHAATLAGLSIVLVALPTVQMLAIRWLRPVVFGIGVEAGFYPVLIFSLLTMAPYALLIGYVLPYSLFYLRTQQTDYPGTWIYLADSLGDTCGGALFTFVLVVWVTPLLALVCANVPLAIAAARLMPRPKVSAVGLLAALLAAGCGVVMEKATLRPPVGTLVQYKESPYARLTVHQDVEQITLFADGRPIAGSHDPVSAEQVVHYPLSQLDHPQRILLISTQGGLADEMKKYGSMRVDYVELDPAVAQLMEQYALLKPFALLNRVNADGRAWLRDCAQTYDAILLNLPEPDTFQLNRFFTDRFFALADRHLSPQGIFSFSVEGSANYLNSDQRRKLSCLWATANAQFRYVAVLPGERMVFLCRQTPIDLDIPGRLADLGIATRFVGPYFYGDITADRIEALKQSIDAKAPLNRDARPYLMQVMASQWFTRFGHSPHVFMVVLAVGVFFYLLRMQREEYVLFSTGLVVMGAEIVLIFAFQIFLGYIYAKIGMIVTAMLAGLLPGAWWGYRHRSRPVFKLLLADTLIIVWLILLVLAIYTAGDRLPAGWYYAAGFILALICGFQLPLALARLGDDNRAAARLFSVDLVGAAFGALVTSTVLIPYVGLGGSIGALAGVKAISLMVIGKK